MAKKSAPNRSQKAPAPKGNPRAGVPGLSSSASLLSKKKGGPAPEEKEQSSFVWSNLGKALEDLPGLATEIRALQVKRKAIDDEIKAYNLAIEDLMEGVDKTKNWSVRDLDADWVACYVKPKPGEKLIPQLLIQAGVTDAQLKKGTKIVEKAAYVSVRARNEKFEKEEE